mmetsp:Transcript_99675/g.279147  ORF Transcript_99675/g.279147 Transcript_99675/m.279147 type:complete len:456 (-) Transcript_99675:481-1848(-)
MIFGRSVRAPQAHGDLQSPRDRRGTPGCREEHHASEGVDVGRNAVRAPLLDLRSHVVPRAGPRADLASLSHEYAQAEVCELRPRGTRCFDENVRGLQVAVQDGGRLAVQVRQAPGEVLQQLPLWKRCEAKATGEARLAARLVLPRPPPLDDELPEVTASDPLEDQGQGAALKHCDAEEEDDVGVPDPAKDPDLVLQAKRRRGAPALVALEVPAQLDGDVRAAHQLGLPDIAEAAGRLGPNLEAEVGRLHDPMLGEASLDDVQQVAGDEDRRRALVGGGLACAGALCAARLRGAAPPPKGPDAACEQGANGDCAEDGGEHHLQLRHILAHWRAHRRRRGRRCDAGHWNRAGGEGGAPLPPGALQDETDARGLVRRLVGDGRRHIPARWPSARVARRHINHASVDEHRPRPVAHRRLHNLDLHHCIVVADADPPTIVEDRRCKPRLVTERLDEGSGA